MPWLHNYRVQRQALRFISVLFVQVPERAGPGPADPSSVMWMYHSHTSEVADTYTGLMGAIIISRAGAASASGKPKDVDRHVLGRPV